MFEKNCTGKGVKNIKSVENSRTVSFPVELKLHFTPKIRNIANVFFNNT